MSSKNIKPKLKGIGLFIYIAYLTMIPPLGTDLYMPALPSLVSELDTTDDMGSITMMAFLLFMALGMLVVGALSDKYGRKRMLAISSLLAFAAFLGCAFSQNIFLLLVFRCVQGFFGGSLVSVSTAMIGDNFKDKRRMAALSISQAFSFAAPVVAPIIGVFVLDLGGWRGEFFVLAALLFVAFIGSLFVEEVQSADKTDALSVGDVFRSLARQITKPSFIRLMVIGTPPNIPYMAYLGVASFIYISMFHTNEFEFSCYFAVISLGAILGSLSYMKTVGAQVENKLAGILLVVSAVASTAMLIWGSAGPLSFLVCMIPFTFCATYLRPYVSNRTLAESVGSQGAASSAMNFLFTGIGSLGMLAITLGWPSYIIGMGWLMAISTALSIVGFIAAQKKH